MQPWLVGNGGLRGLGVFYRGAASDGTGHFVTQSGGIPDGTTDSLEGVMLTYLVLVHE